MESIALFLDPYKNIIAGAASIVTSCHQLSGAVVCNSIRKEKTTAGRPILPFLAGAVIAVLALRFGLVLNDVPTIRIGVIGVVLSTIYISCFMWYTIIPKDKAIAWTQLQYAGAFLTAVIAYTYIENPEKLQFRYGMLFTGVIFSLVSAPLFKLPKIIRKKSTAGLPFPMILTGTTVSFLWFLYGIVSREKFVIFQNGAICLLNAVQLSLFLIYPSTPAPSKKQTKDKKKN